MLIMTDTQTEKGARAFALPKCCLAVKSAVYIHLSTVYLFLLPKFVYPGCCADNDLGVSIISTTALQEEAEPAEK